MDTKKIKNFAVCKRMKTQYSTVLQYNITAVILYGWKKYEERGTAKKLQNFSEIEREQKGHKFYNGSKWLQIWKAV